MQDGAGKEFRLALDDIKKLIDAGREKGYLTYTGLIGFLIVIWFIVSVYRSGLRGLSHWNDNWNQVLRALVGCTGILVHSFADFNLQIPANALFFYFLSAVVTGIPPELRQRERYTDHLV